MTVMSFKIKFHKLSSQTKNIDGNKMIRQQYSVA
jgi:hypothetical protein